VIFAEVADGAVVGTQVADEPDGLEVFGAGVFEAAAGAGALEIAPEVEFEEAAGMIGTAALGAIVAGFESQRGKIQAVDKGVDGAHGAGGRNAVVHRRREQHRLVTVASFDRLGHGQNPECSNENRKD
jgi:hypothetical protein